MDGNRRWATARNMAKHLGHHQGERTFESIVEAGRKRNISHLSFWALAKKNIEERSPEELSALFRLCEDTIIHLEPRLIELEIRFETVGDLTLLPESLQREIERVRTSTRHLDQMTVILALGYGGQDEIVRATRAILRAGVDPDTLTEREFASYLDTGAFPPPDLIIRTGGDTRHSGYFLYQAEYSEYYFSDTLWPDFSEVEFDRALASLGNATRNFGK